MSGTPSDDGHAPAGYPLAGTVSKAVLIVSPAFAGERDFVQYLKYRLYDSGFIVVREESRLLNYETTSKLCINVDAAAAAAGAPSQASMASTAGDTNSGSDGGAATAPALPSSLLSTPEELVGMAYIFVLARTDCHRLLESFVTSQLCGEDAEVLETFLEERHTQRRELPFWMAQTAHGARLAVGLLFPRMMAEDVPTAAVSREYVQANVKQALVPALTELARQKPEDPLRWLATQLLVHNPQSPLMMSGPY